MRLAIDRGVFYRVRCIQNETGNEFGKSREIINYSILRCISHFLQHTYENRVLSNNLKCPEGADFRVYLRSIETSHRLTIFSVGEPALSKFCSLSGKFLPCYDFFSIMRVSSLFFSLVKK